MADVYVRSGAAGAGTGADWTNAYTTLAAAFTGSAVAGNDFWVADDHAETQASTMTLTCPGTATTSCRIICVDHTVAGPAFAAADLRTTATITTTGAIAITMSGSGYYEGITFSAGTTSTNALTIGSTVSYTMRFKNCLLRKAGTSANTAAITFATGTGLGAYVELINTQVQFGHTGDSIRVAGVRLYWRDTADILAGATVPTVLFNTPSGSAGSAFIFCEGLGFQDIVGTLVTGIPGQEFFLKDCRIAATTILTAQTVSGSARVYLIRADSAATNYRNELHNFAGKQEVETSFVRVGGASDGTTAQSWKITTSANSERLYTYDCEPISIWNDNILSAVTVTVYGFINAGAVPADNDIFMEVEYLGNASYPLGSRLSTEPATSLTAAGSTSADTSVWGDGSDTTTPFKLTKAVSPLMRGPITVYVRAALASTTYYIDPKVVLS